MLNEYLNKLSSDKLDEFISAVEQIEFMEDGEESEIMVKKFSDSEKGKFIQKLNTIHKQQSEKISKYLGKLIIHFRNS
jgi:bifunctional DNA-binding transcriptional regulator/antitoxin component of YhaV-PrlF toxin-antitoxin module